MKTVCRERKKAKAGESVEVVIGNFLMDARKQQSVEHWLKRTEHMVKSYAVGFSPGMWFKRAIKFGQLRRGLVLRKRMEERR